MLTEVPEDSVLRLVDGPEGRGLELVAPGAPSGPAARLADFFPLGLPPESEDSVMPPVGHCSGVCLCGCDCLSMSRVFVPLV